MSVLTEPAVRLVAGVVGAVGIPAIARRAGALTSGGAVAAAFVGGAAIAAGWSWAALLILYFTASTAVTRWRATFKATRMGAVVRKGGARDAVQGFANGAGVFVASLWAAAGHAEQARWCLALGAGSLAASAADTWATEIGVAAGRAPRSVLTWRPVPAGTSGGVSLAGSAASVAGAACVAAFALLAGWPRAVALSAVAGGVAGSFADSVLGATLQARRWCPACDLPTEQREHRCGTVTRLVGGAAWIDNDAVNLIAGLAGGLFAAALVA